MLVLALIITVAFSALTVISCLMQLGGVTSVVTVGTTVGAFVIAVLEIWAAWTIANATQSSVGDLSAVLVTFLDIVSLTLGLRFFGMNYRPPSGYLVFVMLLTAFTTAGLVGAVIHS